MKQYLTRREAAIELNITGEQLSHLFANSAIDIVLRVQREEITRIKKLQKIGEWPPKEVIKNHYLFMGKNGR